MDHVEIRLSGAGGQGLILAASILAEALSAEGYHVAHSQAFDPVSRGGLSLSDLVAAKVPIDYPLATELDMVLILDQAAVDACRGSMREGTLLIVDRDRVRPTVGGEGQVVALPLVETARSLGNVRVANMAALGAMARLGDLCRLDTLQAAVRRGAPSAFVDLSLAALAAGESLVRGVAAALPFRNVGDRL